MYAHYGARNYKYTKDTIEAIRQHFDGLGDLALSLHSKFDNNIGVFPCRMFNIAKQSASVPHTDHNNLAQGWCSIML